MRSGQVALIEEDDKFERLCEAADAGYSVTMICRIVPCHHKTAVKYLRQMDRAPCPCGRPANHRGQCRYRKSLMPGPSPANKT